MSQKGEAFRRFAFLLTSSIMPHRGKTSALTIALLCLPVIVLGGRAFYLNQVQLVPLVVSKVINNSLSPNMAERNVQMILWLDYPAGKKPEWWGQPVQSHGLFLRPEQTPTPCSSALCYPQLQTLETRAHNFFPSDTQAKGKRKRRSQCRSPFADPNPITNTDSVLPTLRCLRA